MSIPKASPVLEATITECDALALQIADLEEALKAASARRRYLNEHVMKELIDMEHLNSGAELSDGTVVDFKRVTHVTIAKPQRTEAIDFIIGEGGRDLVKATVTVEFGRNFLNQAEALAHFLRVLDGATVEFEETVHPSTLKKWVVERLEGGLPVPECFGIFAPIQVVPRG